MPPLSFRAVLCGFVLALVLSAGAHAATGAYSTPGTLHGEGLPTTEPQGQLELRTSYLWATSSFTGRTRDQYGIIRDAIIPEIDGQLHLSGNWWLDTRTFAPFAASTHYDEYWQGAFHLVDASIETINTSPGLLWANGEVAVRVAPQFQLMRKVGFSQGLFVPGLIAEIDGGDAWGIGAHLAVAYRPWAHTEFSLGYWSQIAHKLDDGHLKASALSRLNLGMGGTEMEITTPDVVALRLSHTFSDTWAGWALCEYTLWSDVLPELRIHFDVPVLPDSVVRYEAKDAWIFEIGAEWKPANSPWSVEGTAGYASCFTTDARRHPSLMGAESGLLGAEVRYTWASGVSTFFGAKWMKYEPGVSKLGGANLPYGFPYGTLFGQLHGHYDGEVFRIEGGVRVPLSFLGRTEIR